MKKLLRSAKRDIVNNFYHILSLAVCLAVLLSVSVGLLVAKPRILAGADNFYDALNYWDIKISAESINNNVISAVKADSDVKSVYAQLSSKETASLNDAGEYGLTVVAANFETLVHSPQNIPICPTIVRGTYPKSTTGCLAIIPEEESNALKIGDKITVASPSARIGHTAFTVTGVATSPLYTEGEIIIYVVGDVFATGIEATDLLINLKSLENVSTFSPEFDSLVSEAAARLKGVCVSAQNGQIDITDTAENQLEKAKKEYDFLVEEAKTDLEELTKNIDNMKKAIDALTASITPKVNAVAKAAEQINGLKPRIDELIAKGDTATAEEKKQIEEYNVLLGDYEKSSAALATEQANLELNKTTYEQLVKDKESYKQISDAKIATAKARVDALQNGETLAETTSFTETTILADSEIKGFSSSASVVYAVAPVLITLFGILAVVLTAYVVYRIFDKNRREVVFLEELTSVEKMLVQTLNTFVSCVLGGVVGSLVGIFLTPYAISKYFEGYPYDYPYIKPSLLTTLLPVAIMVVLVAGISVGTFLLLARYMPKKEVRARVSLPKWLDFLGAPQKLILKNALQYKKRYILPFISALIVQILIISALRFSNASFVIFSVVSLLGAMVVYSKQTLLYRQEELRSKYISAVPDYTAIGIVLEAAVTVSVSAAFGTVISALFVSPCFEKLTNAYTHLPSAAFKAYLIILAATLICSVVSIILGKKKPAE